jgi:hypothetical protein
MTDSPIYTEKQRFKQWWLWLILFLSNGYILYKAYFQFVNSKNAIDKQMNINNIIIEIIIIFSINLLFYFIKLETRIDAKGITVRFFPFHLKERVYNWEEIKSANTRTYNPLLEYGGWGIRGFGNNRALNISGNKGLQLEFKNGKKLLIGTVKPSEIESILSEFHKNTVS